MSYVNYNSYVNYVIFLKVSLTNLSCFRCIYFKIAIYNT